MPSQCSSQYDSRVVIYEHKMFIRLATDVVLHILHMKSCTNDSLVCYSHVLI